MSRILRVDLLRLGRSFAAGKRPTHPLVANYQRCFAEARVVLTIGLASLFDQHGPGIREVCTFLNMMFFMIFGRFCKVGTPPRR